MSAEALALTSRRLWCLAGSAADFLSETAIPFCMEATAKVAVMMETEPPPGVGSMEATWSLSCEAVNVHSEVHSEVYVLLKLILRFRFSVACSCPGGYPPLLERKSIDSIAYGT